MQILSSSEKKTQPQLIFLGAARLSLICCFYFPSSESCEVHQQRLRKLAADYTSISHRRNIVHFNWLFAALVLTCHFPLRAAQTHPNT